MCLMVSPKIFFLHEWSFMKGCVANDHNPSKTISRPNFIASKNRVLFDSEWKTGKMTSSDYLMDCNWMEELKGADPPLRT